ncbi:serine/threonine-protein kinase [Nonomuraea sp. NPDC050536]|uniref:serine/threonine-protein kinase n=1 Tax=Nonomuraea sp. NPDC050536 TaxID=3364366 RepID=UPI0037C5C4DC
MDLVPGYREVRQLGAGHSGRVFLATYQATGAYVAIKYLNATLRRDDEFMARFRTDSHALVEIDDPNVVKLYEYVETPTRAAVVMELVDGVSLRTILAEHGRITPEAALVVLKGTLLALAAAHERGVPHHDVKPENVLVQADGTSKLADFGIVVHAEEPGVPAGSPPYMSPELWTNGTAGPPADLYAAACVLFETVRGRPPFRGPSERATGPEAAAAMGTDVAAIRDKHLVEPVPLEVAPDTLRDLLRRGMAKDPAARYASARQFAAELEEDAVAGYGPEWEQRGRRHLAELATLLALKFPLAKTASTAEAAPTLRERTVRVPRLPPHLWIAAATVVAVLIAALLSGGRLPPGPGTVLMPPPKSPSSMNPSSMNTVPVDDKTPERKATTPPPPVRTTTAPPTRRPQPSSTPTPPAPAPTPTQARASVPARPAVQAASIMSWSGSAGSIKVAADGTGPVRLTVSYTRRDGDGPVRTLHTESRTLAGKTAYVDGVQRDLGTVACGQRSYFGIVVMTDPASANGPQVSEVAVDGPACPGHTTTPTPTQHTAAGSPTPDQQSSQEPFAPTDVPSDVTTE